jgi:hypothetical protein
MIDAAASIIQVVNEYIVVVTFIIDTVASIIYASIPFLHVVKFSFYAITYYLCGGWQHVLLAFFFVTAITNV